MEIPHLVRGKKNDLRSFCDRPRRNALCPRRGGGPRVPCAGTWNGVLPRPLNCSAAHGPGAGGGQPLRWLLHRVGPPLARNTTAAGTFVSANNVDVQFSDRFRAPSGETFEDQNFSSANTDSWNIHHYPDGVITPQQHLETRPPPMATCSATQKQLFAHTTQQRHPGRFGTRLRSRHPLT